MLKWKEAIASGFYELPEDSVIVPFHSMAGQNPGHLVWDDWLPIYSLLATFEMLHKRQVFMRFEVPGRGLWASCQRNRDDCTKMMQKFMPLMGMKQDKFSSIYDFIFTAKSDGLERSDVTGTQSQFERTSAKSQYVCSPSGAAGLGMVTDHGLSTHGWVEKDYTNSHNRNRATELYAFRNFMLANIGVSASPLKRPDGKIRIVFSTASSSVGSRSMSNFHKHITPIKRQLGKKYNLEIIQKKMSDLSLVQQAELVSTTAIFVTVCGGGAVSATFLPKGASLFVFFHDEEGKNGRPVRLDWDYLNHLGYVRTHWIPRPKQTKAMPGSALGPTEIDYDAFVRLMDHELDIISHL